MKRALAIGAALAGLAFLGSCDVQEGEGTTRYISILAPDTLLRFDTVLVVAKAAGTDSTLDTLWDAPVRDLSDLARLKADHYAGGPVDVLILGLKDGLAGYGLKVAYRGSGRPEVESSPAWDTLPPRLSLKGRDSLGLREGEALRDTGATCADEHPGMPRLTVAGKVDSARAGSYELEYACRDRAGNVARAVQRILVRRWPDTLAPELRHPGDSLTLAAGATFNASGIACHDDRDTGLAPVRTGTVDTRAPGTYELRYHCADSSGNRSPDWVLRVRVLPWPDTVAPVLALIGPESLAVIQGAAWTDPGATCQDAHDGARTATVGGTVDTGTRGEYRLTYACADSAGNAAPGRVRIVRVVRAPDPDKPVLTLRGGDSLRIWQGSAFIDPGADCVDARDGVLPVARAGAVDAAVRGVDTLWYRCSDSAGNLAEARRLVAVARSPDTVKPVIALKGPDSVQAYDHEPFADPGADCQDDRDGPLRIVVKGQVDTAKRGRYVLDYICADSAGNEAQAQRVVRVVRRPDSVKPVITLIGSAHPSIAKGRPYADSGAACVDDRDGSLPVTRTGTVDTGLPGDYPLKFGCADSAGNAADTVVRTVTVNAPADTVKPLITLLGPDSIPVLSLSNFDDPGATCIDDKDGALPAALAGFDPPSGPVDGYYRARYTCTDKAGNKAEAYRVVKSGLYTRNLMDSKDASIDTTLNKYNNGLTGFLGINKGTGEKWFSLYRFDLAKVDKAGLKSAKLRMVTWPQENLPGWTGGWQGFSLKVWGVRRDWIEGTGNWYYNRGAWQNNGATYTADYIVPDWVRAASTDPAVNDGVTGADRDLVRPGNATLLASATVPVRYDPSFFFTKVMAPPAYLRVVEIDVTDYVKNTDPALDYGFTITCDNCTARIGVMSRETNDGLYAPRLMLSY